MLDELRAEIDRCDSILAETLCRRFALALRIGEYKKERGLPVYHPGRETAVIERIAVFLDDDPYTAEIQELYRHIFQLSRRIQTKHVFPFNLVLVGFMGSGKTTVGKYLAELSGYTYYDVDDMIEQQTRQSVPEIFDHYGEAYFRSLEQTIIEKISTAENAVIACGGGAVLSEVNVEYLKKTGKFIWLQAEPETVFSRLKDKHDRPLIQDKKLDDIKAMLLARRHFYSRVADYTVTTDSKTVAKIGQEIFEMVMS